MLSRRCVAAASSRSDSARMRSARATASATICSAFCSDSVGESGPCAPPRRGLLALGAQPRHPLLRLGELLLGQRGSLLERLLGLVAALGQGLLEVRRGLGGLGRCCSSTVSASSRARGDLALGVVEHRIDRSMGVLEHASPFAVDGAAGFVGIAFGFMAGRGDGRFELEPVVLGGR